MFDGEIWKDILGYEGYYQVSSMGRVRGIDRLNVKGKPLEGRVLKPAISMNYKCVALMKNRNHKTHKVHSLVCEAFLGKRDKGIECNHINGDKLDNRVENLEYCTRTENILHARKVLERKMISGCIGEKHGCSKLRNEDIINIRLLYSEGVLQIELARMFNVRQTSISNIVLRKSWRHI